MHNFRFNYFFANGVSDGELHRELDHLTFRKQQPPSSVLTPDDEDGEGELLPDDQGRGGELRRNS